MGVILMTFASMLYAVAYGFSVVAYLTGASRRL